MAQDMSGPFTYPLEETNGNARPPAKRADTFGSQDSVQNGNREDKSVRRTPSDHHNIMSDSENVKHRRQSLKAGNTSARKRSRNTLREKSKDPNEGNVDDSAWIHRDKLAQIEIQEMEEAGIPVRQSRRSISAGPDASARSSRSMSRPRRPMSKDQQNEQPLEEETYHASSGGFEDFEPKRISTILAADESEHEFDPNVDTEFRSPQEIAAERESIRPQVIRPSTSRIPISKASPVPVPSNMVDRDSPLPRSRHGSGNWSGNWDEMLYARRARSNSIGSQAILDEDGVRTPPRPGSSYIHSSTENSPPKARVPTKTTPKSGGRKASTANGAERPPSSSGKDRPGSRAGSGHKRPSTSHQHAPEGDPPWIASMYKPDPRLPPEQQMLPTHAKRMMQEQWEKEGKTGTAYDQNFRLLNDEEFPAQPKPKPEASNFSSDHQRQDPPRLSPKPQQTETKTSPNSTDMNAWPLTPQSEQRSDLAGSRPSTSGGLKLTPTIPTPPPIEKSLNSHLPPTPQGHNATSRVPDFDEKEEAQNKRGSCGCCVVM